MPCLSRAFIVKSVPLETVRWLVTLVVIHPAVAMLRSAAREPARVAIVHP